MKRSPPIQCGLFGGYNEVAGLHTVAAHTRVLESGSEVLVPEHVRWNRGRQPKSTGSRARARKVPKLAKLQGAGANLDLFGQLALLDDDVDRPEDD
ncbi:MAG: hypothetical protein ACJAZO_002191 [Myxococcota bacterium]|jgi:hypothetical protein